MSSVITADARGRCAQCAGTDFKITVIDPKIKLSIATCASCGSFPDKIRIRRSLPIGLDGKANRVDIRYNRIGEKIADIEEAKHIARSIDYDIKSGRFDPNDYRPRGVLNDFLFENFVEKNYLVIQEKKLAKGVLSPAGFKNKKSSIAHLKKALGEIDIRRITSGTIFGYYEGFTGGDRARDLSIQELQIILKYAYNLELITKLPQFPKIKKAKIRDVEKFLTDQEQEQIINAIEVPLYRLMVEVLVIYAMRPCEVRALQWRDLDFFNGVITIQRHFSDGVHLRNGRKSNESIHYLPMTERFMEIIDQLPRSIKSDDFIFKGREGGAVADRVLARHWAKAIKKLDISYVELYEGTKHSRLSFLKRQGFSDDQLLMLSGHTNVETLKRYAQVTKLNKVLLVKEMIQ